MYLSRKRDHHDVYEVVASDRHRCGDASCKLC
jgi:hypothetical protein